MKKLFGNKFNKYIYYTCKPTQCFFTSYDSLVILSDFYNFIIYVIMYTPYFSLSYFYFIFVIIKLGKLIFQFNNLILY